MSKQAQLADGTILEFPDETPDAIMDAAIKHHVATENLKTAQAAKYPTAEDLGGKKGEATVSSNLGIAASAAKDLAHRGVEFAEEQGPEIVGATAGGIVGAPAGPAGVIAGGAAGAAGVRAARNLIKTAVGPSNDERTATHVGLDQAKDIAGQAVSGAIQEAGPVVAKEAGALVDAAAARAGLSPSAVGSPTVSAARTVGPYIKNRLTAEQQAAIDLAKTKPALYGSISADVKAGSKLLAGAKAAVKNLPGSAGTIDENEQIARAAYQDLGEEIGNRIGGTPGKLQLGDRIQSTVSGEGARIDKVQTAARDAAINDARAAMGASKTALETMSDLGSAKEAGALAEKSAADVQYSAARKILNDSANAKEVQTGTKSVTSPKVYGPDGQVVAGGTKIVPVMETIKSPVDLLPGQNQMRPIFEKLKNSSTIEQQKASPGYQALKAFMGRSRYISADDAINLVSGLGDLASDAFDFPGMSNASGGISKKMWGLAHDALDKTAKDTGALDFLNAGRALVKEKFGTYGTSLARSAAKSAETKPIENFIRDGNIAGVKSLLEQTNAAELPAIRRRVIDGFISGATGFDKKVDAMKLAQKWNSIGPELKGMVFTPEQIAKMDKAASPELLYGPNHPVTKAYGIVKGLVSGSGSDAVNVLVKKDELGLPELRQVLRLNPSLAEPLGKTTFQGIMDGATNANGDFLAGQAFKKWNSLGMQTQLALTRNNPKLVSDISSFFRLGSMMKQTANPSGSGSVLGLIGYGKGAIEGAGALAGFIAGGLEGAEAGAAGGAILHIAGVPLAANQVAKLLYAKDGAALLTKALTLPSVAPQAEALMERLIGKAVSVGALEKMPNLPALPTNPKSQATDSPPASKTLTTPGNRAASRYGAR